MSRRSALTGGALVGVALATEPAIARSTASLAASGLPAQRDESAEHVVVYRDENAFCAWPFYCGLWQTADGSILAGFKLVPADYSQDLDHYRLTNEPGQIVTIRSRDVGRSWDAGSLSPVFDMDIRSEDQFPGGEAADWSGLPPLDFASRDTLVMAGGLPSLMGAGAGARAWVRASTNGGRTWRPHALLPNWDFPGITMTGSSQYSRRGDGVMLFGVQGWAEDRAGPVPVVYASPDGVQFPYLGTIVEERPRSPFWPGGRPFSSTQHMYPRVVVLPGGKVLASIRYQRDPRGVYWTEIHESLDHGRTWRWLSRVNDWGAPGDLVPMDDGRVVCVYGHRLSNGPGIRYRVTEDEGLTWGTEMILRDDGGSWDLGYPRVIELAPGRLLATYYFNLASDPIQRDGGVRHIACTLFQP